MGHCDLQEAGLVGFSGLIQWGFLMSMHAPLEWAHHPKWAKSGDRLCSSTFT